jgi:hypothetical protein
MKIDDYLKTLKTRCAKEKKPRRISHRLHHRLAEIVKQSHEEPVDLYDEDEQKDRRRLSAPSAVDLVL